MAKQNLKSNTNQTGHIVAASFEGPIPPPEWFAKYEEICPGAADRILSMAENQANHRQGLEQIIVKSNSRDSMAGIICGFLLGISTIIAGTYIVLSGRPIEGTIFGGLGLAALVGVFIYGTRGIKQQK